MFPLETVQDYVVMLLLAAGLGAIGGVVYELILTRGGNTGTLEGPGRIADARLVDIGWLASALIGAVTAVGLMYFFPPDLVVQIEAEGQVTTHTQYELIKLIALSLLFGASGPSLLTAATSRVQLALQEQKVEQLTQTGQNEIERLVEEAKQQQQDLIAGLQGRIQPLALGQSEGTRAATLGDEGAGPDVASRGNQAVSRGLAVELNDLAAASAQRLDEHARRAKTAIARAGAP